MLFKQKRISLDHLLLLSRTVALSPPRLISWHLVNLTAPRPDPTSAWRAFMRPRARMRPGIQFHHAHLRPSKSKFLALPKLNF